VIPRSESVGPRVAGSGNRSGMGPALRPYSWRWRMQCSMRTRSAKPWLDAWIDEVSPAR